MTITIERKTKTQAKHVKKKPGHFARLGFTNRLAIYIMLFLAIGLAGGFYLALKSITTGYTGALMCWTVVFTPIGTACRIVLSKIVHKSEVENSSAQGEGIKYAMAKANNFSTNSSEMSSIDSPPI